MEDRAAANRRFAFGTIAGVVVGVLLTIGALGLVQPRGTGKATPAPSTPAATATAGATPSQSAASPGASETPLEGASPSPSADARLAAPESGSWFAVIHWMPKSTTSLDKALEYAASRTGKRDVVVLDSDAYRLRGGRTGQWAVGVSGLSSMNEATAACRALGLAPGTACGRFEIG